MSVATYSNILILLKLFHQVMLRKVQFICNCMCEISLMFSSSPDTSVTEPKNNNGSLYLPSSHVMFENDLRAAIYLQPLIKLQIGLQ